MTEVLPFLVAAGCYCLATLVAISLRNGIAVPTAAALSPPVAVVGLGADLPWLAVAALPSLLVFVVHALSTSGWPSGLRHGVLFVASVGAWNSLGPDDVKDGTLGLAVAVLLTLAYCAGDVVGQAGLRFVVARIRADFRTWLLLQGVLLSASGLTYLVLDELGVAPAVAMLLVLVLTKREFEDLARSRVALDQTVLSLRGLATTHSSD